MNKQQQPTTDNTQLIQKLGSEYEELHKKCCKLYAFRHSLDVDQKMNFDMEALALIQRQLELMEAYRHNLYLRIRHLSRLSIKIKTMHEPTVDGGLTMQELADRHFDKDGMFHMNPLATHHCGHDADLDDACCQASRCSCSVCGGTAAACEAPDSIQALVGMLVVDAFPAGHKCNACQYQQRCNAKKVELTGGCFLCLEELPNSITYEGHVGGNGSMYDATLKRN